MKCQAIKKITEEEFLVDMETYKDCAVIGVGNILFKDDGIGVLAAKYLEENYSFEPQIDVVEGGTLGLNLINYFEEYEKVIVLDSVSINDEPGSIYKIPAEELLNSGRVRQTAHEVEVVQMLEICSLLEKKAEVTLIGIVPSDIVTTKIGLSAQLESAFESYINEIIKELQNSNINVKKTADKDLKNISIANFGSYN
jgi:hydrogenase maturation protease